MIIVSNYLHREKVQDIKEVFYIATNTMRTKDVRIRSQAEKMKLLIRLFFFHMQSEYPLKQSTKARVDTPHLSVNKARMNVAVENPRHWVKIEALKSKLAYMICLHHLCP